MLPQRSLKDFQKDHKATKQPPQKDAKPRQLKPYKVKKEVYNHSRLPDRSRFQMSYDAKKQEWSGSLIVPQDTGDPLSFIERAKSLFALCYKLDQHYRRWIKAKEVTSKQDNNSTK